MTQARRKDVSKDKAANDYSHLKLRIRAALAQKKRDKIKRLIPDKRLEPSATTLHPQLPHAAPLVRAGILYRGLSASYTTDICTVNQFEILREVCSEELNCLGCPSLSIDVILGMADDLMERRM